ncbi:MAG TPA: ROK family protein [Acidimicrobiales bacterium]|nr:ROK family protein [Acidimicrobiales bacterium]
MSRQGFGVDVGGSGIKGALVDLDRGALDGERFKVATPSPSTPAAVAAAVAEVVDHFAWRGAVGVTYPGVVTGGVARTAANVDKGWIGTSIPEVVGAATGLPVTAVNDADAAGVAEARFGAAAGHDGLVIVATLGTGIGSALLAGGRLVPNSELGHVELDGVDAETRASAAAREREELSWERWAKRLTRYFGAIEDWLWPELFVVGGGVSRKSEKFLPHVDIRTPIVPAVLRNGAGIVGAAVLAAAATPGDDAPQPR